MGTPTYQLGFRALHDAEPDMIGDAVSNEGSAHDPDGDATIGALQDTEHGLLVYSARRNRALFVPMDDAPATPPAPPPPAPSGPVGAIDVSSNNGSDIGGLIERYRPRHVITKLYQRIELGGNGARYSIAQARTAHERGCTVGGYVWLYQGIDGARQVAEALETARAAGIALGDTNPLWIDLETYPDGTYPRAETIRQAVAECRARGVAPGIYSGRWFVTGYLGNTTEFKDLPLWDANYTGVAGLVAPTYGGWDMEHLAGTQWSGNPVDRSTFKAEYATEGR